MPIYVMQQNNDQITGSMTGLQSSIRCPNQIDQNVINYQKRVKDITDWLFEKEKQLLERPNNIEQLSINELLNEYVLHERFIEDFYSYGSIIMKCKEDGIELRENDLLVEEDRDEVGLQVDKMDVCYEKLKILSSDRLNALKKIIEEEQSKRIEQFEELLLTMEKKIYNHNNIGPDCNTIRRQLVEMDRFREVLEEKQDHLESLANIIVFDDVDLESLQFSPRSYENLNLKLEKINNRWENICKFVNDRTSDLQRAKITWDLLDDERPKLLDWLRKIEESISLLTSETSQVSREVTADKVYSKSLIDRSERINDDVKRIQTMYTSLEQRTRMAIEAIDDKCSMFLIELEKALEDIQDNWNSMMHAKRMLDYQIDSLSHPSPRENCNMTQNLANSNKSASKAQESLLGQQTSSALTENHRNHNIINIQNETGLFDESYNNNSSSISNDLDKGSSLQVYSSISDPIPFDDSSPSSKLAMNIKLSDFDIGSDSEDDELSTNSLTASFDERCKHATKNTYPIAENYIGNPVNILGGTSHINHRVVDRRIPNSNNRVSYAGQQQKQHNCRVEEWKLSLDSFSSWLKRIEASLGIDETILDLNNDSSLQCWSQSDPHKQLLTIIDIEKQINSNCQEEFDCLISQGQQIISDLIPEIDGNVYEANLKEIISDIELRFDSVKNCLNDRKNDLIDQPRWLDLSKKLKISCEILIEKMSKILPESEIGEDLITLAQEQDQLIRSKSNLVDNTLVQSSLQESNLFLKMCETLQQQLSQLGDHHHLDMRTATTILDRYSQEVSSTLNEMWMALRNLKDDIETQLDRLNLHYSELSQLIDDRLERLDEVHKEMHALQHSMQELSKQLQVVEILRSNWGPLDDLPVEQLSEQLEDLKLFRERISDTEGTHELMNSIVDWMTQSDVPLSQQNLKRISELNTIWTLIQVSTEDRQKQIELAFDNLGSSEQKFLASTLYDLPNWERRVAASKVPYFVDHTSNKTKWDHPKFTDMLNNLNSVQQVVFSAYRTALKFRIIQKTLGIDLLMLENFKGLLDSLSFCQTTNDSHSGNSLSTTFNNETLLDVEQIIILLKAIYDRIQAEERPHLDVALSIDLTLNWLLNLYDQTRTGYISTLSLKVGLALLCCATREEKYIYMYDLIANTQTQGVDGRRLGTLFEICMRIPIYLGEGQSFGGTEIIESNIRDCFSRSKFNPEHPNCIDRDDYCNWLKTEPQFIIWLPVLHRLLVSENISHPVKCKLCKANPIIGLRYRCLKCFNYNICQNCFLTGRHIGAHFNPNTHPMQEYCCPTGSGTKVRDFGKILKNKLNPSR